MEVMKREGWFPKKEKGESLLSHGSSQKAKNGRDLKM